MPQRKVHRSSRSSRPRVALDLQANEVRIDGVAFGEQWTELYAVLVDAAASNDPWVTADDLKDLGLWRYKKSGSIGKEILRHAQELAPRGAGRVIESPPRGGTTRWRLAVPPEVVTVIPKTSQVRTWIHGRRAVAAPWGLDVARARQLVQASVSFQGGRMEEALDHLQTDAPLGASSVWDAWHALLLARVQLRLFDEVDNRWEDMRVVRDAWRLTRNALGKAMDARLTAMLAYSRRFEDVESALESLGRLAPSLERSGDLSSLAVVTNMLGLLTLRHAASAPAGRVSPTSLRAARAHFERAAGLFGLIGDPWALQAALFNAARALRREYELEGQGSDDTVFAILDLSLEVCESFHVGGDSLQAEAAGAEWAWDMGRPDLARGYCQRACAHAQIDNTYEQAVLARLLGRQAMIEGRAPEARQRLETARRLFAEVGDHAAVEEVRQHLLRLPLAPGGRAWQRRARSQR
jgi:tetratricopeptide (TPR) repeat protein